MMSGDQYERYIQQLDPEIRPAVESFIEYYEGGYDLSSADKIRGVRAHRAERPRPTSASSSAPGVDIEDRYICGYGGEPDVRVWIFGCRPRNELTPVMLWSHGGGFLMGEPEGEDVLCSQMARNAGILVVSVDYRLAPEHPYPAPLHDCYAAFRWLHAESESLGVNSRALMVGGASAGGAIMASMCHMLRDLNQPTPLLQVLAAPALDNTSKARLTDERIEMPPFSRNLLVNAWESYLGTRDGSPDLPAYAAAARASDVSNLPPAYITVGALDPLRDENFAYTRRLIDAGVGAELHVYPRACHGFEIFAPLATVSQRCLEERVARVRAVVEPYR